MIFVARIGTVAILSKRWRPPEPDCSPQDAQALGPEKTVALFSIWGFGAAMGLVILAAEMVAGGCGEGGKGRSRWSLRARSRRRKGSDGDEGFLITEIDVSRCFLRL